MRLRSRIPFFDLALLSLFLSLGTTGCIFEAPTASVYLTNDPDSAYAVSGFYFSTKAANDWSENLLSVPVAPGEMVVIEGIPRQILDIKIVFSDPASATNIKTYDFTVANRLDVEVIYPGT